MGDAILIRVLRDGFIEKCLSNDLKQRTESSGYMEDESSSYKRWQMQRHPGGGVPSMSEAQQRPV